MEIDENNEEYKKELERISNRQKSDEFKEIQKWTKKTVILAFIFGPIIIIWIMIIIFYLFFK